MIRNVKPARNRRISPQANARRRTMTAAAATSHALRRTVTSDSRRSKTILNPPVLAKHDFVSCASL